MMKQQHHSTLIVVYYAFFLLIASNKLQPSVPITCSAFLASPSPPSTRTISPSNRHKNLFEKSETSNLDMTTNTNNDINNNNETTKTINRVGGRRILPSPSIQKPSLLQSATSVASVIGGASVLSLTLDALLMQSEALQVWRYLWPLVGMLYVSYGVANLFNDDVAVDDNPYTNALQSEAPLPSILPQTSQPLVAAISLLGGIGLLIGGFMDAFFPVWYTSPDILGTRAGIESDSAAILLMLSVFLTPDIIFNQQQREKQEKDLEMQRLSSVMSKYNIVSLAEEINPKEEYRETKLLSNITSFSTIVLVVLFAQLWELGAATFYSWGEILGLVS